MQVKIYSTNDIDSKLKTRPLYEECFDEGEDDYIDYYYKTIIKRNEIVVVEDGDKIASMIHLNPYTYNIDGKLQNIHYLVAIATEKEYRHKGMITMAMNKAIEYLKSLNEPFCYLVPENSKLELMYSKFGFRKVCKFTLDKFSNQEYNIYPDKNEEYMNLMKIEQEFLDKETDEYRENLKKKNVFIRILDQDFKYSIEDLKSKRIYVCQEV